MIGRLFDAQRSVGSSQMHYCDSCQNTHYLTDGMLRILIYRIACRSFCLLWCRSSRLLNTSGVQPEERDIVRCHRSAQRLRRCQCA